ncbi:MAG: hypothetical protein ABIO70_31685 [Pseudomonadota bacterium]
MLASLGDGFLGRYARRRGGVWLWEGPRPGPDWHRHDWRPIQIPFLGLKGLWKQNIYRRRWRLAGTTQTSQDHCPDEVLGTRVSVLTLTLKLWVYLSSGHGVQTYDEVVEDLEGVGARRTVQRWLRGLAPSGLRLQQALRTAVIERLEPKPVEDLFPGGVSPPWSIGCRRWKAPEEVYSLATALTFLFAGALALKTTATVLLAEAHRRLDGPMSITAT